MLSVRDLTRPGLAPASFDLADGECVAVRGVSGSGKTLLLRAVADLDPAEGTVTLDGAPREAISGPRWRRLVGYLPAEPGWWGEAVAEHFVDWAGMAPMVLRLGLPIDAGGWPVARLSTGERQRLALLRAIERRPRVLLLDEPTAALDSDSRDAAEALLAELRAAGLALLWVTHDAAQAARVAGRALTVVAGRVT